MAKTRARARQGTGGAVPHTVTAAEAAAMPAATGVQAGDEVLLPVLDDGVPTFTVRADSPLGIRAMVAISRLEAFMSAEERELVAGTIREFELFEERERAAR